VPRVKVDQTDWPSKFTTRHPRHPAGEFELLEQILAGTPKLEGALCPTAPVLFDAEDSRSVRLARETCSRCPALSQCGRWARQQAPGALVGVVAARLYRVADSGVTAAI
jgi:hypothetical protein